MERAYQTQRSTILICESGFGDLYQLRYITSDHRDGHDEGREGEVGTWG